MPWYCYRRDDNDQVIEFHFPVGKAPDVIIMNDGVKANRSMPNEWLGRKATPGNWPMTSDALGVAHNQVGQATKEATRLGVPTEFTKDGRAILRNPEHRKRLAEALGMYDRNGGYSDPQRR